MGRDKDIEVIIKNKWDSNVTIEPSDLGLLTDEELNTELGKYGYFIFDELNVIVLITKNEFFILLDIYFNKVSSLTYLKSLLEITEDELDFLIAHLRKSNFLKIENEFLYFFKESENWRVENLRLRGEYNEKKIKLAKKQLSKFNGLENKIKNIDSQLKEYEEKVKGIEVKAYQNVIVFMGIFISIFSLISVNFNIFEKAMNLSFCDLLKFILVVNVSLGIVIFMLLKTIKNMFILSKK